MTMANYMADMEIPPQNIRAEFVVLGAMINDDYFLRNIPNKLVADDFYRECHRVIFFELLALSEYNKTVDISMLRRRLKACGKFDDVGGEEYLEGLSSTYSVTPYINSKVWACAKEVAERAWHRKLLAHISVFREQI